MQGGLGYGRFAWRDAHMSRNGHINTRDDAGDTELNAKVVSTVEIRIPQSRARVSQTRNAVNLAIGGAILICVVIGADVCLAIRTQRRCAARQNDHGAMHPKKELHRSQAHRSNENKMSDGDRQRAWKTLKTL